jgi:uncharacterized circularly permuted ATP-grasp superfamily protein/uncharacterized alpha-E superfamily protein
MMDAIGTSPEPSVEEVPGAGERRWPLLQDYKPQGVHDELLSRDGTVAPHWRYLIEALHALGSENLHKRHEAIQGIIQAQGISYRLEEGNMAERPLGLDPVPILFDSASWRQLESGLIQRAELLRALLADLYGPQRLLQQGLLPPEVVFGHPGFLRPCMTLDRKPTLTLYGADLTRNAQGQWMVSADHLQNPLGMGYALEARVVLARALPSLFREAHPHRLRLFFQTLRNALLRLGDNQNADSPSIAVLSAGTTSSSYPEDAYLAHYLGYPLIDGNDLRVIDGKVRLRTVSGTEPVHVLMRRNMDAACDPLELERNAIHGTPGLLHAVRLGSVALSNTPGAGIAENLGLYPFLERISQALLGTRLQLPCMKTLWLGNRKQRAHVLRHKDDWVIRHLDGTLLWHPQNTEPSWRTAKALLDNRPGLFVAHAPVFQATTPSLSTTDLRPQTFGLRAFAVADEPNTFYAMPGALGVLVPPESRHEHALQLGGITKDVWVLSSEPVRDTDVASVLRRPWPFPHQEGILSRRVADNLFWMARYMARAEMQCRSLHEMLARLTEAARVQNDVVLQALMPVLLPNRPMTTWPEGADPFVLINDQVASLAIDSLRGNLAAITRTARAVRERLDDWSWRLLHQLEGDLERGLGHYGLRQAAEQVFTKIIATRTLATEGMQVDPAHCFLHLGQRLENALQLLLLLEAALPAMTAEEPDDLAESLYVVSGVNPNQYRNLGHQVDGRAGIISLMVLEPRNPSSMAHLLAALEQDLDMLGRALNDTTQVAAAQALLLQAQQALVAQRSSALLQATLLDTLSQRLRQTLRAISDLLTENFLRQPTATHQLVNM